MNDQRYPTKSFCALAAIVFGLLLGRGDSAAAQQPEVRVVATDSVVANHPAATASLPAPYKVVGGGARANWSSNGSLLTQSRPGAGPNTWTVSSKDHFAAEPVSITAFAIGLADPADEWEAIVRESRSPVSAQPVATASLPPGYAMTGGGCLDDWRSSWRPGERLPFPGPAGNLLTGSFPSSASSWECRGQEHGAASPASIVAYVIGIRPKRAGVPLPEVRITSATSEVGAHVTAIAPAVPGFVITGGGAVTGGAPVRLISTPTAEPIRPRDPASPPPAQGQLLTATFPEVPAGSAVVSGWRAMAKDHIYSSPGIVVAYAVNLRFAPPSPPSPPSPPRALTVVTANQSNAFTLGNITWEMKMDRLAQQIADSGQVPDIISMTESSGWTSCDNSGDYDLVDRLIWRLRERLSVTYRVAYLIGAEGAFGPSGRCRYYSGDTVLYNPIRITNLTPSDVATRPQVAHNDNLRGFQVRRSLPICNRGARTNIPNLEQLIDGPRQLDKCNRATPAGPAWAWQVQNPDGSYGVVATLARFGWADIPGSSFDVATVHPTAWQERWQAPQIDRFITGLTGPPYRTTRPYYPLIVLGDFNCLVGHPPYGCLVKCDDLVVKYDGTNWWWGAFGNCKRPGGPTDRNAIFECAWNQVPESDKLPCLKERLLQTDQTRRAIDEVAAYNGPSNNCNQLVVKYDGTNWWWGAFGNCKRDGGPTDRNAIFECAWNQVPASDKLPCLKERLLQTDQTRRAIDNVCANNGCPGNTPALPATPWPAGTIQVFVEPEEVMAVALGTGAGPLPPLRTLKMQLGATLPAQKPCRPPAGSGMGYFPDRSFSDHCGLLVRFTE